MRNLFLGIFVCLLQNTLGQGYTAEWKSGGHEEYLIQQSVGDTFHWRKIGTIKSKMTDSVFSFDVPGPTYYYRIVADQDTSKNVLVYNIMAIEPDSVFRPQTNFENSIKIINAGQQLKISITSQRDNLMEYQLADIAGRVLQSGQWFIKKGLNTAYLPFNWPHGIYIIYFQTAYGKAVRKVVK